MIYFNSFESRRSASFLPPVWQVGQYCSEESAKDTSAMVSPQTSHFSPVRPCTRSLDFFSPFKSLTASPSARWIASESSPLIAANNVPSSTPVSEFDGLNGLSLAACRISSEYDVPAPSIV